MRNTFITLLTMLSITILSSTASAEGILLDSNGNYVTDGFGECVSVDKLKHFHKKDGSHYCNDEPKAKAEPKPAPKPVVHETVTLGAHALFDTDSSVLRAEGKQALDELASKLKGYHSVNSISVTGHTDSRGATDYNTGLSNRRAASVKTYLTGKGIDAAIISTAGRGESSPVASNKTAEGRQQNRRVEIGISAQK